MPTEVTASSDPLALAHVAARSASAAEFESNLRDFLRALRALSTRARVAGTIADEPPLLAGRFPDADVADDHLAICAGLIAVKAGLAVPVWACIRDRAQDASRFAKGERLVASTRTASIEITLGIRAGRPSVSIEHKRRTNAERQRRFRARRAAEWRDLRRIAGREQAPSAPSAPVRPDITLDLQTLP